MRFLYLLPLAFLSSMAHAADSCEFDVTAGDSMSFNTRAITVPASCDEFTINFSHTGHMPNTAMGHNWVLTKSADMTAVLTDGQPAGIKNAFIAEGDERVIAHTPILGGGEQASVTFATSKLSADEKYTFFCSYPGHSAMMQGKLTLGE